MLIHVDLRHFHRPVGFPEVRGFEITGGVYKLRGAIMLSCGDEPGTVNLLTLRFGERGLGTLDVEVMYVPPILRQALLDAAEQPDQMPRLPEFSIDGLVIPAGSLCAAWSVADSGPVSLTVGPVSKADVSALIVRQYKPVVA